MAPGEAGSVVTQPSSTLSRLGRHVRSRLVSGLFVLVPLYITIFILGALFNAMAKASFVRPLLEMLSATLSPNAISAIAIFVFILMVYLVGLITTQLIGKRLVTAIEGVILKIPLVKNIYSTSKQIVDTISPAGKESFKSVVFIDFPRVGIKSIGFVTGSFTDRQGRSLCKVFVPTAPNPTTGFLLIVSPDQLSETDLTVEDAIKLIISGGVLSHDKP